MLSHFGLSNSFDPTDCRPPGSSVHGILQARIPEWVSVPSSRGSPQLNLCLRSEPVSQVSWIGRWILYSQRHLGSPVSTLVHHFSQIWNVALITAITASHYVNSYYDLKYFMFLNISSMGVVDTGKSFFFCMHIFVYLVECALYVPIALLL